MDIKLPSAIPRYSSSFARTCPLKSNTGGRIEGLITLPYQFSPENISLISCAINPTCVPGEKL